MMLALFMMLAVFSNYDACNFFLFMMLAVFSRIMMLLIFFLMLANILVGLPYPNMLITNILASIKKKITSIIIRKYSKHHK